MNAAIAAQILIDTYKVEAIINSGTAGGMNPDLEIYDSIISTEVAYHDVAPNILTEFHPWLNNVYFQADKELLELSRMAVSKINIEGRVYWGRMVTGEAFIDDEERSAITERFAPMTVDMESASVAHVCYVNRTPFISIRCVTDTATHSGIGCFEEHCKKASIIAKNIAIALLNELHDKYCA